MSEEQYNLEEKVKDWLAKNPKWNRFKENMKMLKALYAQYNVATSVSECVKDCKVAIEAIITKDMNRKPLTLCSKCFRKSCDQGSCGADDYKEFNPKAYSIMDNNTDRMIAEITPFATDIEPLELDATYLLEGIVNEFQNKKGDIVRVLTIQKATKMIILDEELDEKVLNTANLIMQTGADGKVEKSKFDSLMGAYTQSHIDNVMKKLNLKIEGIFVVRA